MGNLSLDRQIVAARGPKNAVDPQRPYAFLVEEERSAAGQIEPVATLFLTNRECPLRCIYCDLWKNTTDERVVVGDIPRQIDYALARLAPARQIKLYNSGNFFDPQAIPREDHAAIADRVKQYGTVIVESHPIFCDGCCAEFRRRLEGEFEVAVGLETADPAILPRLNKRMTLDDFRRTAAFLRENEIHVRAFILHRPPYCDSDEAAIESSVRSVEFAMDCGARCCSLIPTRGESGFLEDLSRQGQFAPPSLASLEAAFDQCLRLPAVHSGQVRVFVDLWDVERLSRCSRCSTARIDRLRQMNLSQQPRPRVSCVCGTAS